MKTLAWLCYMVAAFWVLLLLTDYIYKKTNDNTYVYCSLAVFALTGVSTIPAIACFIYRRFNRP